jgi:hypothetical protein
MHLGGHKPTDDMFAETDALKAEVDRLSAMTVAEVAAEIIAKAYTGQPAADASDPPWPDPYANGPSAYDVANWLFLPHDEELDTSGPQGRILYALVSEALQALEHVSILRTHLSFGYQGTLADGHLTYVITRHGVSVRDGGEVERVLGTGSPSG